MADIYMIVDVKWDVHNFRNQMNIYFLQYLIKSVYYLLILELMYLNQSTKLPWLSASQKAKLADY